MPSGRKPLGPFPLSRYVLSPPLKHEGISGRQPHSVYIDSLVSSYWSWCKVMEPLPVSGTLLKFFVQKGRPLIPMFWFYGCLLVFGQVGRLVTGPKSGLLWVWYTTCEYSVIHTLRPQNDNHGSCGGSNLKPCPVGLWQEEQRQARSRPIHVTRWQT